MKLLLKKVSVFQLQIRTRSDLFHTRQLFQEESIFDKATLQGVLAEDVSFLKTPPLQDNHDYRFGKINIEQIFTMDDINYISGYAELDFGVVHLFKEAASEDTETDIVCVLAVPAYMTPSDYLGFVGVFTGLVQQYRIIRDSQPNRYMVLMKFVSTAAAKDFVREFEGRSFTTLEEGEICHVVLVRDIESKSNTQLPIEVLHSRQSKVVDALEQLPLDMELTGQVNPQPQLIELPTCAVCLERMDAAVSGLVTVLCHHTFHCNCLQKWNGSSCPVCRFSVMQVDSQQNASKCQECEIQTNLWICLICGHLGCGRYHQAHAFDHFRETSHLFALEIETQRVWDYASDNYVHRLIRNRADGKVVELPGLEDSSTTSIGKEDSKMDKISYEFSQLLSTSLESQRAFYENQMAEVEMERDLAISRYESVDREVERWKDIHLQMTKTVSLLESEVERLLAEKQHITEARQKQILLLQSQLSDLQTQLAEEQSICQQLRLNQQNWNSQMEEVQQQIQIKQMTIDDLQEQVHDLMQFLEARDKVEHQVASASTQEERDDIRQGSVHLVKGSKKKKQRR